MINGLIPASKDKANLKGSWLQHPRLPTKLDMGNLTHWELWMKSCSSASRGHHYQPEDFPDPPVAL